MKHLFILAIAFVPLVACKPSGLPDELRASAQIQKVTSEAEIPTTVTYTQIYATGDQETHFRNVTVKLISTTIPPTQPEGLSAEQPATTIRFASFPAHWGDYDRQNNILHTPGSRRFISLIQGNLWIKTSDGETRRFGPGNVVEALDAIPSKGHITWVGEEAAFALFSNHP